MDSDRLAQLEFLFRSGSIYDRKLALDELSQARKAGLNRRGGVPFEHSSRGVRR